MTRAGSFDINPVLLIERDLNDSLSANRLWYGDSLDPLIIVIIRADESRRRDFFFCCGIKQADEELVGWSASLGVNRAFKRLEAEAIDSDPRATARWTRDWAVVSDERVLVVLESRVGVFLVNDTL